MKLIAKIIFPCSTILPVYLTAYAVGQGGTQNPHPLPTVKLPDVQLIYPGEEQVTSSSYGSASAQSAQAPTVQLQEIEREEKILATLRKLLKGLNPVVETELLPDLFTRIIDSENILAIDELIENATEEQRIVIADLIAQTIQELEKGNFQASDPHEEAFFEDLYEFMKKEQEKLY